MKNIDHLPYIEEHGKALAGALLTWYEQNKRDLPWRKNHNPYRIWISEVMLQQTQVDTVIDYFNRFMVTFPTIEALAGADEEQVLKAWEGLGYYSRAKRLKQAAQVMMLDYDGAFPTTYAETLKLPGIGPYTAGAVMSIAYNLPVPAVDGNVLRVFSRVFNDDRDIGDMKTRKAFEHMAKALLPEDSRHFNQALMELGATVCTPKNPRCEACPIHALCRAKASLRQKDLPVKKKRQKNIPLEMEVALVRHDHHTLIVKRSSEGLLADLWGFPIVKRDEALQDGMSIHDDLEEFLGVKVKPTGEIKKAKHVFSHRTWHMTLYAFDIDHKVRPHFPQVEWIDLTKESDFPLPTAFKKLIVHM